MVPWHRREVDWERIPQWAFWALPVVAATLVLIALFRGTLNDAVVYIDLVLTLAMLAITVNANRRS